MTFHIPFMYFIYEGIRNPVKTSPCRKKMLSKLTKTVFTNLSKSPCALIIALLFLFLANQQLASVHQGPACCYNADVVIVRTDICKTLVQKIHFPHRQRRNQDRTARFFSDSLCLCFIVREEDNHLRSK